MITIQKRTSLKAIIAVVLALCLVASPLPLFGETAEAYTRPGYNGKIVYSSWAVDNTEVYTMNSDGTDSQRLTIAAGTDSRAEWSPDGSRIAFLSTRNGNSEIYIMNADGTEQINLSNNASEDTYPRWSPDGSKIAFSSNRDGGSYNLYTVDSDGSNLVKLSVSGVQPHYRYWKWSPDGSRIAYTSAGLANIYTISPDGSGLTQVTTENDRWLVGWLPNNSGLYYSTTGTSEYDLHAIDLDGTNARTISALQGYEEDFIEVSPDGTRLAVVLWDSGWSVNKYAVMNIDGGDAQIYDLSANGVMAIEQMQWSPDSQKLLLSAYAESTWDTSSIYTVNYNGTSLTKITTDEWSIYGSWQSIPNTPPVTTSDSLNFRYQTPTLADVIANDTDEEALSGDNLSISIQPTNGTASTVDGKVRYVPNSGYQGADSLTYQICDSFMPDQLCSTGVLNITVQAPVAPNLAISKVNGESFSSGTNSYVTSSLRPALSGTASPDAEIRVEIHSDPIVLTTTANGDGNWSVTPSFDLPIGEHMVYISATLNGMTTELGAFGLTVQPSLANTGQSLHWLVGLPTGAVVLGVILLFYTRKHQFSAPANP